MLVPKEVISIILVNFIPVSQGNIPLKDLLDWLKNLVQREIALSHVVQCFNNKKEKQALFCAILMISGLAAR